MFTAENAPKILDNLYSYLIVPFSVFIPWQALERELAPVEERLSKLGRMTRKVTASNPQEGRQVQARHSEITGLWDKLKVSEILLLLIFV